MCRHLGFVSKGTSWDVTSPQVSELTSGSRATGASATSRLHVLGRSSVAGAIASGSSAATAPGTSHGVLLSGLVAVAVKGGLLAARALGLLGLFKKSASVDDRGRGLFL